MTVLGTTLNVGIFLGPDVHSARPADGLGGTLYVCTTHGVIEKYDLTAGWEDWATITGGGVGSLALDDLTDVDLTTDPPVLNNRLVYDGTNWVPMGGTGIVAAEDVTVAPAGTISATDAQAALEELDTEKVPTSRLVNGHDLTADVTLDDSDIAPVAPNDQTGTTYTFVIADKHRLVRGSNASAQTHTIPPNSSVAYPLGSALQIAQQGAGQITLAAGAGVTIRTPHGAKTSAQYAVVTALKVATNEWYITGDTTT